MAEPTFALWNLTVTQQNVCSFDVRPLEFLQLDKGAESLIEGFLRCLSISGKPLSWTITPFCSPYFAGAAPGENYIDRYPMAWRVSTPTAELSFRPESAPTRFGACVCDAEDPSWQETEGAWNWSTRRCTVIADVTEQGWPEALQRLRLDPVYSSCRSVETFPGFSSGYLQARFDLGVLTFPEDAERVDAFVNFCRANGASVNWATSLLIAQKLDRGSK